MTDQELIELLQRPPEDLSADEIALVRDRMQQSPEVRTALAAQLQLDQILATALGNIDLSVDAIVERAATSPYKKNSTWALFGWGLCLLLIGFVGTLLVRQFVAREPEQEVAQADDKDRPDKPVVEPVATEKPTPADAPPKPADAPPSPVAKEIDPVAVANADRSQPPNEPGATAADDKDPPLRMQIEAESFARGNVTIELHGDGEGIGIIRDAGKDPVVFAEYDIKVPHTGAFALQMRYAADKPRPIKVFINGRIVSASAASRDSHSGGPDGQIWTSEGLYVLFAGPNVVRFEASRLKESHRPHFPHIDKFALTEVHNAEAKKLLAETAQPWEDVAQLGGPPRPFEQVCFDDVDQSTPAPQAADLKSWFTGGQFATIDTPMKLGVMDGMMKLNAPWPEDAALRFSLYDPNMIRIHVWHGDKGVTLRYYNNFKIWVAHGLERRAGKPFNTAMVASDDDRTWRTNPAPPIMFQLRCQQGQLVLSRGDVRLIGVPFEGVPSEVDFEGHTAVRSLAMLHSPGLPEATPERKTTIDIEKPATLQWKTELAKGAQFNKLPDGSVELRSEKSENNSFVSAPLPDAGVCEIIAELDGVQPGGRFFLGDDAGNPKYTIGLQRENATGNLAAQFIYPWEPRLDTPWDAANVPGGFVAPHFWVKLVVGCGTVKGWTSVDGVTWAKTFDPALNTEGPLSRLGLCCPTNGPLQTITLRRLSFRPLPHIMALAPADLYAKAVAARGNTLAEWVATIDKSQPPGVDQKAWRRACALKSIASGVNLVLGTQLIDSLVDAELARPEPNADQLNLLDEVAEISDTWYNQPGLLHLVEQYERLGTRLYRAGEKHPYRVVVHHLQTASIWSATRFYPESRIIPEALYRPELLEDIYAHRWDDVRDLTRQLRLLNREETLLPWAEHLVAQSSPEMRAVAMPIKSERQHPLIEELSKEAFNVLAEFEAALASKAYRDACQIIAAIGPNEAVGLLPSSTDPNLLVSLGAAMRLALQDNHDLQQTMVQDFGKIAALRQKQAAAEADVSGVQAVAVQFQGTSAAADALLWLGDRALSSGDFIKAHDQYRQAQISGGDALKAPVAARQRLTAALLGRNEGSPVSAPVDFGETHLSPAEFEAMIADLVQQRSASSVNLSATSASKSGQAPAAANYQVQQRERLENAWGNDPAGLSEQEKAVPNLDWIARHTSLAIDGERLIVNTRIQLAVYDLKSGQQKWRIDRPPTDSKDSKIAQAHDWALTPMRPLVAGGRIYVRQLLPGGPELVCVDAESHNLLWKTPPGLPLASDPVLVQNELRAITYSRNDQFYTWQVITLDPATGAVSAQHKLISLRDSWWSSQHTCQVVAVNDGLVVVGGGTVLYCDNSGKLRWARRQDWIPPSDDRERGAAQIQSLPLVDGDRVLVTQPGVRCVECLDLDTGALRWRSVVPNLRQLCGLTERHLILQTGDGVMSLSADDGAPQWYHDAKDVFESILCGGPGGVLYFHRLADKANPALLQPEMVWLDPANGKIKNSCVLESLKQEKLLLGPVVSAGDHLWALAGREPDVNRTIYELAPLPGTASAALPIPMIAVGASQPSSEGITTLAEPRQ